MREQANAQDRRDPANGAGRGDRREPWGRGGRVTPRARFLVALLALMAAAPAALAQFSPRAQFIVDFLGLVRGDNFKGVLVEEDGVLKIAGKRFEVVGGTVRSRVVAFSIHVPTRTLTVQGLEPAGIPGASGSGASALPGGDCVVGHQDAGPFTPFHALRWTRAGGAADLGTLDPPNNGTKSSFARSASADCSVVVGYSDIAGAAAVNQAFRWSAAAGMVGLGAPAGAARSSRALATSADGSVIVGDADFPPPTGSSFILANRAFRWTAAGGFQDLGALGALERSIALAVSGDGATVVGQANGPFTGRAFRWTAAAGLQSLGTLPGHAVSLASGVSDNGRIVAGISSPGYAEYRGEVLGIEGAGAAFRWTASAGMQDLRSLLVATGVNMTGINLLSVTAMSADGQWLAGHATTPTTPSGETVPYVVQYCDDAIGAACSDAATAPSFAIAAANSSLSAAAGASASTALTVTPSGGFNGPVTFACTGLPPGAACSFAPASVTPSGAPVMTTLTITTDGGPVAVLRAGTAPALALLLWVLAPLPRPWLHAWTPAATLLRRRWAVAGLTLLVLAVATATVGCGGGGGGGSDRRPARRQRPRRLLPHHRPPPAHPRAPRS